MTEEHHRKWDIIIKGIITPIVAVITVLAAVYQYTDSQEKSLEKEYELKKLERQEMMFEEKKTLYKETRQVLSFLSSNKDLSSELYRTKENRFWELYWGDLASVESDTIESLMVRFGNLLTELKNESKKENIPSIQSSMKQISLHLAHQTNEELTMR